MSQPISSLNLPNHIINKLENNGFYHCEDIGENFTKFNLPNWSSLTEAPKSKTALELSEEETHWEPVTTFIPELDPVLANQIIPGTITELTGFSGTGKTQICLHLTVGAGGKVVFVHTNKNLNPKRLKEIADMYASDKIMENALCIEATDPVELLASVQFLENWLPGHKVKLLLVDSITWPLKQQSERTRLIYRILQNWRALANLHNFAVVITNNSTTRIRNGETYHTSALGDRFYHLINNRILLSRENDSFQARTLKSVQRFSRDNIVSFKF